MQVYALTSSQVARETLDLFLTREAADAEPREILEAEPEWVDVLSVVPIELDERTCRRTSRGAADAGKSRDIAALRAAQVLVIAVRNCNHGVRGFYDGERGHTWTVTAGISAYADTA